MAVKGSGDIYALPQDCIVDLLSLTSPKDVCRLSAVASTFCSASQSDTVWDRFLPSDYHDIISRAVDGYSLLAEFPSKKDLYLHLCDHPILIDGGRRSFSLEKLTGKKCYTLAARDLVIVWGDSPQYWQWINLPESRFPEVAELLKVCWFEIRGKININMLSPGTHYAEYLVFTCKSGIHGFQHRPAEAFVGISGCESEKRMVCLDPEGAQRQRYRREQGMPMEENTEYVKLRSDGWMEVELGEHFVKGGQNDDGDFEVSVMNLSSNWKSGIIIQGIEIRPKD